MPDAGPPARWFRFVQYAGLVVAAAGAVIAAQQILSAEAIWNDRPMAWARVVVLASALMAAVVLRWPHHAASAATLACLAVAVILLTPAPVTSVALVLGSATLAGDALVARRNDTDRSAVIAALIGIAVMIGAFAVVARLRIHYAQLYAAIAVASLIFWRMRARTLVMRAWSALTSPQTTTATERVWFAIAGVIGIVHIVVAGRPEVGYDASTMHLQFAELVGADHRFRYGIDRYLWAKMPLGADYAFATAYVLGGEAAARALNLAFGALAVALVYRLGRLVGGREAALACATLFAAMPLAMLITGSLFSESLWVALLLGSLVVAVEGARDRKPFLPAFALLAGGAMATKVMGVFWFAILIPAVAWVAWRDRSVVPLRARDLLLVAIGATIGAWAYVAAWIGTGNPVFPFLNTLFRSPFYDVNEAFNNPNYNASLRLWTPWELVRHSGRFIEGRDGALGLAWLFAVPLVLLHVIGRPTGRYLFITFLAIAFFVAIYMQQSYLRYLLPALALIAVLASAALTDLLRTPAARAVLLAAGLALVAFDLRAIANAYYPLAAPCTSCLFNARDRQAYVERYAPLRVVSQRLNRELPDARIGFMLPNEPAPAGYAGASRSGNWHDDAFFRGLVRAPNVDALAELAQKHRLTHIVYRATPDPSFPALSAFAKQHATPLWRVGDYVVAALQPASGG